MPKIASKDPKPELSAVLFEIGWNYHSGEYFIALENG